MTWLSTKQTSEILGISGRAVRIAAQKNRYVHRYVDGVGRGGKVLEISLESLPDHAQALYHGECPQEQSDLLEQPAKKRDLANWRAYIVEEYQHSGLSPVAFVERHNQDNPEDPISKHQLFRWQNKYKAAGSKVEALLDNRGGYNRGSSSITFDQWEYFEDLYLRQQKLSIQRCWEFTGITFGEIPSVATFERRVKKIPKLQMLLYREGEKAYKDALPHIRRQKEGYINSNDIWFSDHHLCDVFVKNKMGKIVRLWLTAFMDARSNKIVSVLIRDADPNVTAVKQCLRIGIEQYGVPSILYVDNGADYKAKEMTVDYPLSLCGQLGIGHIFATPYHPEAKGAIERFFGIFEDRFGRLWPTYAGSDAKKRPEVLRQSKKKTDEYLQKHGPDMDTFIDSLHVYIDEYNKTPSHGIDMFGKCPDEIYYSRLEVKREVDQDVLRLLCGRTVERVVQENYVRYNNQYYISDQLLEHVGEPVYLVYDPSDMRTVSVFDQEGHAICTATEKISVPYGVATEDDYRRARNEIKAANKVARRTKPARQMDVHSIMARNKLLELSHKEDNDASAVSTIRPALDASVKQLKIPERRRLDEEDSVLAPYMDNQKRKEA